MTDGGFLAEMRNWLNDRNKHGTVLEVLEVRVERGGCGEGTCSWDNICIDVETPDGEREIRLENMDIAHFFQTVHQA